ncbi:hypothetical protein AB1Y20_014425 [Prymnesium parvum]|uniref:Protein kinase domain-containing protein n=1 Tax=Prymnesium parvum TaxID=97485 RepID=A0AB34IH55_PRYPA
MERYVDTLLTAEEGLLSLYEKLAELGGAQAGAVEVISRKNGVHYALRTFTRAELSKRKRAEILASIEAQRRLAEAAAAEDEELASASFPRLHEVLQSPRSLMLVSDVVGRGGDDLLAMIERRGRLKEADARQIFSKLVLATKKVHDAGVVLRSIKPEAVQVAKDPVGGGLNVWIADLRCAIKVADTSVTEMEETLEGLHGTPEYSAPEELLWYWHEQTPPQIPTPPPYGFKVDVWALGMCLHVMLCGCFPFDASLDEEPLLREIWTANFSFSDPGWAKLSAEALDLVGQLLQREPADRPFLEEVLQHPFCAGAVADTVQDARDGSMKKTDLDAALAALDMGDEDD